MPSGGSLLAFALAAFVLIVVPGPSVLFVIGRSIALGRRAGLLSVLGNALGVAPQLVAVAFGVGFVVAQSIVLFTIIKLAGAAYLVYLGIQAIRHRKTAGIGRVTMGPRRGPVRILAEGFVVGITNPKSLVFFVAVLPQFVDYHAGAIPVQMTVLGGIFLLIGLASDATWALIAGTARQWFARSPKRSERMTATGGVMMIGLGGILALSGSKG